MAEALLAPFDQKMIDLMVLEDRVDRENELLVEERALRNARAAALARRS